MDKNLIAYFNTLLGRFNFLDKYANFKIKSVEDIKKIPFTNRLELQRWRIEMSPEKPIIFYESTGGKAGENFFIGINRASHDFMIKRTVQAIKLMKVKKEYNCLNLLFSDLVERGIVEYGGILMSVGDVHSQKTYQLAQDALKTLNIKYVFACPNLIYDVLLPLGKRHTVKKCMVSGELLLPWFREYFYKNTGISLYNWYGSSGGFIAAQENPNDEYMRILDEGLYLELINNAGNPIESGRGCLVYTDLFNYSTPIIRYLLEDEVELIKRGKYRYVKIYRRIGEHMKLDGELVYKGFVFEQMKKILGHKNFLILVTKSEDYKDLINILLLRQDSKKIDEIKDFFNRNIGLKPKIKISEKILVNRWLAKKGQRHIIDLRNFNKD